jgi:hypothetical protein
MDNEIMASAKYKSAINDEKYTGNDKEVQRRMVAVRDSNMDTWEKMQQIHSLIAMSISNRNKPGGKVIREPTELVEKSGKGENVMAVEGEEGGDKEKERYDGEEKEAGKVNSRKSHTLSPRSDSLIHGIELPLAHLSSGSSSSGIHSSSNNSGTRNWSGRRKSSGKGRRSVGHLGWNKNGNGNNGATEDGSSGSGGESAERQRGGRKRKASVLIPFLPSTDTDLFTDNTENDINMEPAEPVSAGKVQQRPFHWPCGAHVIDLAYDDCCKDCLFVGKINRKLLRFARAIRKAASQGKFRIKVFFFFL